MKPKIKLEDCQHRHVYRINSRNLSFGVFIEATGGFVGIREKFGHRYLFTEYHWDNGPPFGTVSPKEDLGPLPDHISEEESLGVHDPRTGRLLKSAPEGERGWIYTDNGEKLDFKTGSYACNIPNTALFEYLDALSPDINDGE